MQDMTATGVQLKDLSKTYNTPTGPIEAVRGIDLTLAHGETVAVLGPNGAGKSTTLEMLLGLTPPDAGSVSIFGRPPGTRSTPARSGRCCSPPGWFATSRCASSSR